LRHLSPHFVNPLFTRQSGNPAARTTANGLPQRLLVTVLLAVVLSLPQTSRGDDFFPLGVYWPHSYLADFARNEGIETWAYVDKMLGQLKKNHCNLVWVTNIDDNGAKRICELAVQHQIQVALLPEAVMHPMRTRQAATSQAATAAAAETFNTFGQVAGIWGYVLDDEPPVAALPYLEALQNELLRLDPARPITTVFRRTEAVPAIRRQQFDIVTYDSYPFGHRHDPNMANTPEASRAYYRHVNESLGRQCAQRGVTLWVMPGAFQEIWGNWYWSEQMTVVAEPGCYLHWRMPTVGETRWMVWEGLAGGARGVVFFTLWPEQNLERTSADSPRNPHHASRAEDPEAGPRIQHEWDTGQPGALLHMNSTSTPQLVAMGEAYREVKKIAPVLQQLRFSNIPVVFSQDSFRTQTFRDKQGNFYAMVVNDNTDEPVESSLMVLPGIEAVEDLCDGKRLKLAPSGESALGLVALALDAGGGTLLKLKAPPARRPLAKLIDDFSTPVVVASLEGAEVQVVPRNRDVDWKYHVVRSSNTENMPGTVTYKVHHGLSLDPSGPIYVVYQGGGEVQLSFSVDGEHFIPADEQGFNRPVPIPMGGKLVRFMLPSGESTLDGFVTIATEKTADSNF